MSVHETTERARADWEARIGRRDGTEIAGPAPSLPAPRELRVTTGAGQVTLDWPAVDGAVGYLVHRDDGDGGPLAPLDHHGGDVLAVPHPPYADTTGEPGRTYRYAVATLADVGAVGPLGSAVDAGSLPPTGAAGVSIAVDAASDAGPLHKAWQRVIGSEHLSHAVSTETTGGRVIGDDLTEALRLAHDDLGVRAVRAHAILCDDLGVYREVDGEPVLDFGRVDAVYDRVLALGLRPVVELSFMPRDLASDPDRTVFAYGAIISPPRDWGRWRALIRDLTQHLVDRYGLDEVRDNWAFEVWNEANLDVFWSGTRAEHVRLYDEAAAAVKSVHPGLRVGGPSSAAGGWMSDLVADPDRPVDFLSTHTYGSPPLDFRPLAERHGRPGTPLLWTEYGVTPTHFNPVCDSVFTAAFLLRAMRSVAGRVEGLACWVVSDHFEELGRPPALLHGGFGLLTVGNLRKPSWWALALASRLGSRAVPVELRGDGAGSLVQAWAARSPADGRIGVLVWNATLDQSAWRGSDTLARTVSLTVDGLDHPGGAGGSWTVTHHRVDATLSNVAAAWAASPSGAAGEPWPATDDEWAALRAANTLDELTPPASHDGGPLTLEFELPMPSISFVEITPA